MCGCQFTWQPDSGNWRDRETGTRRAPFEKDDMHNDLLIAQSPKSIGRAVSHFQIFGERRSGTNYLRVLLQNNLKVEPVFHYGWKHGFLSVPAVSSKALLVGVVRDPVDWLISMHATPFAVVETLKDLPFDKFIRAPWESIARPAGQGWRAAGFRQDLSLRGEVLQFDRHPIEGRPFYNIFELRTVKLRALLGLTKRVTHAAVIRHEDARDDPEGMIAALSDRFGLATEPEITVPASYVGNKSNPKRITRSEISAEDRAAIEAGLDWDLEREFRYSLHFDAQTIPAIPPAGKGPDGG
jgi:hypothetical protein